MENACTTEYFESFDQTRLFCRLWERSDSTHTLVIVHGHGEHSGRYEKFAHILSGFRLSLAAMDLRGNGLSGGRPVFVRSIEDYLGDLTAFLKFISLKKSCDKPVILMGHSLGGLISVHWALKNPGRLRALVLSSPCLGLDLPPVLKSLNRWVDHHFPAFYYQHPIYPPHLSHSQDEIKKYRQDKLIQRRISARLIQVMIEGGERLNAYPRIQLPFPLFGILAGLEKVVSLQASKDFFAKAEAPLKQFQEFPGYYHEVFNELGQAQAFETLKTYLNKIGVGRY